MSIVARIAPLTVLPLVVVLGGCDDDSKKTAPTASTTVAAAPEVTSSASAKPVTKADPLDVTRLKKNLRCAAKSSGGPCRVLADFEECEPHKLVTPGGEGRWIGRGYRVKGTDYVEEYVIMRSRRVPLTEVGKGQIGAKVALSKIPEEEVAAHRQARKAVNKLARDDTPKSNNAGIAYLKRFNEWSEAYAMNAERNQVYLVAEAGTYLCQLHGHQRLLVVKRSTERTQPADGLYAELYPATW